tara:strand:+ start:620 stop:856 length:237 start_codon:yes stop_codon:yes gene_type:complete
MVKGQYQKSAPLNQGKKMKLTKKYYIDEIVKLFASSKNHKLKDYEIKKLHRDTKEELIIILKSVREIKNYKEEKCHTI